jgi:ribosomal protein L37AE/L43A
MIEIEIGPAILIYLGIVLAFIFGAWVLNHLKSRKKKITSSANELAICEYCHFAYLANVLSQINKCPNCQCLNKDNWYNKEATTESTENRENG